ncbi:cysteine peptidase family C39 domain-containing protein, partial [Aetokthonos hydrillicola]|uniref:cysteine peptidase family C39 domain-containing protein n=1 Tax=Aetokthonos hydrillicola TaxID=1550245 RepID=UPI001ABB4A2E
MPSAFSQAALAQQLIATLGEKLPETELDKYTKAAEIIEPPVAKQFWDSTDGKAGIYIVLEGKVRLLDSANNLITTLNTGTSFGEMTLFPEEHFEPYIAKASTKLKLCYLSKEVLQALMRKHSTIGDRLNRRAELWDLTLLCRQNSQLENTSVEEMLKALSYFARHNLEIGAVPAELAKDNKLWLLRQGRLVHSQGESLSPGKISVVTKQGSWQATQSTIAYSLSESYWELALQHWAELAQLIDSDSHKGIAQQPVEVLTNDSNIIPFPQPGSEPKQKRKKQKAYFPSPKVQLGRWWGHVTKQYPFYAQQSASDCGAASLVMIGRYWGKRLSINKLRDLANVNRSGSSMRGLVAAAESIGFVTRPVKASLDKLAQQPLPAIAHWEGKHYIVVYAMTRKQVIVGDPAIGLRHLTKSEFKAGWTGYALLLQPTALLKQT